MRRRCRDNSVVKLGEGMNAIENAYQQQFIGKKLFEYDVAGNLVKVSGVPIESFAEEDKDFNYLIFVESDGKLIAKLTPEDLKQPLNNITFYMLTVGDFLRNHKQYNPEFVEKVLKCLVRYSNSPKMQYLMSIYHYGEGNTKEAFKYLSDSAHGGYADAQYNLAMIYDEGQGVLKDYDEAAKWYQKAAEQGNANAQYHLGLCYYKNGGVKLDNSEAFKWFKKSAEQGNADAQYLLGVMYYEGQGVSKDYTEAVRWYCKAAKQGDAKAQYHLGLCYYKNGGVKQDDKEAFKWFEKSAEQGNTDAQYLLGRCYENGNGVTKDKSKAAKWYQKAADQGNADARHRLYDLGKFIKITGIFISGFPNSGSWQVYCAGKLIDSFRGKGLYSKDLSIDITSKQNAIIEIHRMDEPYITLDIPFDDWINKKGHQYTAGSCNLGEGYFLAYSVSGRICNTYTFLEDK